LRRRAHYSGTRAAAPLNFLAALSASDYVPREKAI